MAHTIRQIIDTFQTLHGAVAGINTAGTILPSAIDTEDCPLAMTLPGESVWTDNADLIWQRRRTYNAFFYVAPVIADMPHEGITLTYDLMDRVGETYLDNPTLGGTIFEMLNIADRGYSQLVYNGVTFHGFTYFITVDERC